MRSCHPLNFFFILLLVGCAGRETRSRKNVKPNAIFFDYEIQGDEMDSSVTVYVQFKLRGPNGVTFELNDPAKVELDGETFPVDSAKLTGAYYEIRKPAKTFAGKHTITFTDINKKQSKQEFEYQPFALKTKIPTVIYRSDLAFDFGNVATVDFIRVTATDTSFRSRDINEIDTVEDGKMIIAAEKLKNLVNGPITLLLSKETEKRVKNGIQYEGRIVVSYGLRREFELKDPK